MCSSRTAPTPACPNPGWKRSPTSSRPWAWTPASRRRPSSSSSRHRCWTACWKTCPARARTPSGTTCAKRSAPSARCGPYRRQRRCRPICAATSCRACPTSTSCRNTASAASWPTRWAWARPCRPWPSSSIWWKAASRAPTLSWCPPRCCPTGSAKRKSSCPACAA